MAVVGTVAPCLTAGHAGVATPVTRFLAGERLAENAHARGRIEDAQRVGQRAHRCQFALEVISIHRSGSSGLPAAPVPHEPFPTT